ncbi:MAG: hypothetical protein IKJ01_05380, partial [Lachnospiraceae bacterium]|nr:hypothetical protein [Lachnospiraceae bacterium]
VGTYKLADKIAETHGACLYRAKNNRDTDNEEDFFYAIKEYHNECIPKGMLAREKKISHEIENYAPKSIVIPILDVLEDRNKEYAVMQFRKNGLFLNELIEKLELQYGKGKIPLEMSLEVIYEILSSLEVLHSFRKENMQLGYLHLDLHPGNVFFESVNMEEKEMGKAKFIDFFSALKLENEEIVLNSDTMMSVNFKYSSPEQKAGEYYKYGFATDLFSVGAILFRMLIGTVKPDGESINEKTFFQHIEHVAEHSIIKYALLRFLECSMQENPKYRYQNAQEMLQAVEKLKKCSLAYQESNYYGLFSIGYEMVIPEDNVVTFSKTLNIREFRNSVMCLENDLMQNCINVLKCKYIFELLNKCMEIQLEKVPSDIKYSLYKSGLACCNHTGDSLKAKELLDEIEKIKNDLPLMEYLKCLNRAAVTYADRYEFEQAYENVCRNVRGLEAVKDTYEQVAEQNGILSSGETARIMDLARAYSAKGTYMVWAEKEDPMIEFKKALKEFGNSIGNKMITLSHILQYAIEIQNKELYEEYSKEYFGTYKNLCNGLDLVSDEHNFNPFNLLVFLKGMYTFYIEEVDFECQNKIVKILDSKVIRELHAHPVQLIYKYIGLILCEYNGNMTMEAEGAFLASMTCLKEGKINLNVPINIMMCMTYQTMWIYNELTQQTEENEEILKLMMEHCKESGWEKLYQALVNAKNIKAVLRYEHG